jgi:FtsZ-interacting cell division protein ZipA
MDDLRWILLVIGVAIVAGIYLFGRHRSARDQSLLDAAHDIQVSDAAKRERRTIEDPDEFDGIADQLDELNDLLADPSASRGHAGRKRSQAGQPPTMQQPFDKIIAIHVVAPHGTRFAGTELQHVFEQRDYRFGEHNI